MVNTPAATAGIRPTVAMTMKRPNPMPDNPARAHTASSGRRGRRKTSQISRPPRAVIRFSYRRMRSTPIQRAASGLPHLRASRNTRADPSASPARLSPKAGQGAKARAPTGGKIVPGIGTTTTWAAWARRYPIGPHAPRPSTQARNASGLATVSRGWPTNRRCHRRPRASRAAATRPTASQRSSRPRCRPEGRPGTTSMRGVDQVHAPSMTGARRSHHRGVPPYSPDDLRVEAGRPIG